MGNFFAKKQAKILLLGLDGSGKTELMKRFVDPSSITTESVYIGFTVDSIKTENIKIFSWFVGGRVNMRPRWRSFFDNITCLVFVVDSNDECRVYEAKQELEKLANEEQLQHCPVLVVANKQDLPMALSMEQLREKMALDKILKQKQWALMGAVATTGEGTQEALEWIHEHTN